MSIWTVLTDGTALALSPPVVRATNPLARPVLGENMRKRYPLGNYGLGWVLLALFLVSWGIQTWTGWREFEAEQLEHQQAAEVFGDDGYVWT